MDSARTALRTLGCTAHIELATITRLESKQQMRGGREWRDVRGPARRTRARRNGEGWRGVHRHGRVHQAHLGSARETATALDSQIYGMLLIAPSFPKMHYLATYASTAEKWGAQS